MTTLIEVANTVADQLARNDLGPQISKEITNAVIRYSRRLTYLTEVRGGVMLLNDDQVWYDSFSMNPAYGLQPTENRIAVPFKDVVKVNFARYANVGQVQGLLLESNGNLLTENEQLLLLEQYLSDPSLDTRWYTYLQHEHYGSGEEWGRYMSHAIATDTPFTPGRWAFVSVRLAGRCISAPTSSRWPLSYRPMRACSLMRHGN